MTASLQIVGLISHWGTSPAITPFTEAEFNSDSELNILLCQCSDIRHLLKLTTEYLRPSTKRAKPINVYILERSKQNIARCLLFLTIICETQLSSRERMELFLDLYGNTLIRQKSALYLNSVYRQLINLVYEEHKKCNSPLKEFCNFKSLKEREKDDIEEILKSWDSKIPFDIGEARDRRLRADLETRYDFKINAFDWDYQMYLKPFTDIVHFYHYKMFRNTGVAFETRLAQNVGPNRTLSSYAPGRKKIERDSCLVRGYWGDIWNTPYLSFGIEVWKEPEKVNFFKKINFQNPYNSVDITEWHIEYYINMLEKQEEFSHPFKELKKAQGDTKQEEEKKGPTIEEVEDEEEDEYEKADTQATFEEVKKTDGEEEKKESTEEEEQERHLLSGFKKCNIKVHFLANSFEWLHKKKKFTNLFDVIVFGIMAENQLENELADLVKPKARLVFESVDYLSKLKAEQKKAFKQNIKEQAKKRGWIEEPGWRFQHHLSFRIS